MKYLKSFNENISNENIEIGYTVEFDNYWTTGSFFKQTGEVVAINDDVYDIETKDDVIKIRKHAIKKI